MGVGIRLTDVIKGYDPSQRAAVADLTLEIQPGELVALLGPSGCGKTTTLRLIAGFERCDAGTITIGRTVVDGPGRWVPPEKRGVGMVFQDYALFPHLRVGENVAFGLSHLPRRQQGHRVREVLHLVGLEGYENRYPHELSGGQQQRVALARALAPAPRVLLMDEPFSNLDSHLRDQMRHEVARIVRETGTTTLFVTHDQRDALSIADRVAVMRAGAIEQFDTPRAVYSAPANTFVATFVGKSNLLSCEIWGNCEGIRAGVCLLPCPRNIHGGPGDPILVSVRPEAFTLDPRGPLAGQVIATTYMGDALEATVDLGSGVGPPTPVTVRLAPNAEISPGDRIRLRVDPERLAVVGRYEGSRPA